MVRTGSGRRWSPLLVAAVFLCVLLLLLCPAASASRRHVRVRRSPEPGRGELNEYLADLKDFYTKASRPRFGKRNAGRIAASRRWRDEQALAELLVDIQTAIEQQERLV